MSGKSINGLPILDAKKSIKITINANDIGKADRQQPDDCAVARACRRSLHVKEVRVHLGRVYLRQNSGNWLRYMTPKPLRSEIIAFDRGGNFEPGEFTLSAPQPSAKATGKGYGGKTSKNNRTGKKRIKRHIVTDVRVGPA